MAEIMDLLTLKDLFGRAADLNVDERDLDHVNTTVARRLYMLLLAGQERAKDKGHPVIRYDDVPITTGIRSSIRTFSDLEIELAPYTVIERRGDMPALDMELTEELWDTLPILAGGLTVALAHGFKVLDPDSKNPSEYLWSRMEDVFKLLL